MSDRTQELTRRRLALQARCSEQRNELGQAFGTLERQLSVVERGLSVIRHLASAPLLLGASVGIIVLAGPRRLLRWAGNVLLLLTAYRRFTRSSRG